MLTRRRFLSTAAAAGALLLPPFSAARGSSNWTSLRATRRVIEVHGRAADVFGLLQPDAGAVLIACSVICFAAPALAALVPSSRDFGTPQEA